jgi:hypothetical protein
MGIKADHTNICKFNDFDSPGFEAVAEGILRYTREALAAVKRRWQEETRGRGEPSKRSDRRVREFGCPSYRTRHEADYERLS